MQKILVKKADLLNKLQENKEKHKKFVEEAKKGYILLTKKKLEILLKKVEKNKIVNFNELYGLRQPMDKTKEYDVAIEMLQMDVNDTVELTHEEFLNYVKDQWNWTRDFLTTNLGYVGIGTSTPSKDLDANEDLDELYE